MWKWLKEKSEEVVLGVLLLTMYYVIMIVRKL
jgi:hypothetical protein